MPAKNRFEKYFFITVFLIALGVLAFFGLLSSPAKNETVVVSKTVTQGVTPTAIPDSLAFFKSQQKRIETISQQLAKTVIEKDPAAALAEMHIVVASDEAILAQCHSIGHSIGNTAMKKYKDVSTALRYSDEFCGSGYIHGVIETAIGNSTNLYDDLLTLCPKDSGNCLHGVGHGLMYYTENDIPKSLHYCDTFPAKREQLFCAEGVFMEHFNTDILSHTTHYLKSDDTTFPCTLQKEQYKGPCYFYSPDYYLQLHPTDYKGAFAVCNSVETKFIPTCINGNASRMMKRNLLEPKLVERQCMLLQKEYQNFCIDGMVSYYVVNYYSLAKGRDLCSQLEDSNKTQCLNSVAARKTLFPE